MKTTAKAGSKKEELFSNEEKAAMKERVKELKAEAKGKLAKEEGERAVMEKIAGMPDGDRQIGERLHAIIKENAPDYIPRTWYGMPAYSNKDGKVVIYFRPAGVFNERYITFGFNQEAKLDDGNFWPIAYAITKLSAADEKSIAALVRKAVGGEPS